VTAFPPFPGQGDDRHDRDSRQKDTPNHRVIEHPHDHANYHEGKKADSKDALQMKRASRNSRNQIGSRSCTTTHAGGMT
jgi:hypothetical protein